VAGVKLYSVGFMHLLTPEPEHTSLNMLFSGVSHPLNKRLREPESHAIMTAVGGMTIRTN